MEADHANIPFMTILTFLLAAVVVVPICQRLRVSPILGFLVAGALIGPQGLRVVVDIEGVRSLAEFGVIFLLFTIGLELSLDRLKAMRRLIFGLGAAQVTVTAAAIGLVAWAWGNAPQVAMIVGLALALSSTAMVMQLLLEGGDISARHGRTSFAVLLFQDLAVVPILLLVSVLGGAAERSLLLDIGLALGQAVAAVILILAAGRLLFRPLFHMVAATRSREIFMAMSLLAVIGTAWATMSAGLTLALGPFLAGVLLAETEYRHQIESDIHPFRGLLLGLFFISVGMLLDFSVVAKQAFWITASVAGLIVLKALIAAGLCLLFGLSRDVSIRTGVLLGQGGEFAFVIVGQAAQSYNLISQEVAQFMVIVAALSMAVTPFLPFAARRLATWLTTDHYRPAGPEIGELKDIEGHVVIAGYGRVGRTVASLLARRSIPHVALDLDKEVTRKARTRGEPVFFGDATRAEVLERLNAKSAAAVLITLDDPQAAALALDAVRTNWPEIPVFVRARDARHAQELEARGVHNVVPETFESSLQLAARILLALETPDDVVNEIIEDIREEGYASLKELTDKPPGPF
ncbi:MAG: monovalent cation:proton antiporter-2 (CPA2) family protein [Alphaproteobacteria bacterium]